MWSIPCIYIESITKIRFAIACLGKKLVFHTAICDSFEYLIFKYSTFDWVKKLFKSNQTRYGVSPVYIKSSTKKIFAIACLGKKYFIRQFAIISYS